MPLRSNRRRSFGERLEEWNRKLHYYLGLYFLLFLWLFSFTGLLLNHPRWAISRIPNDSRPEADRTITAPVGATDLERAKDVMRQLGLQGEIELPQSAQASGRFEFNIASPKQAFQIRADLTNNRVTLRRFDRSFWSALRIMHTFSGWRYNAPNTGRDWLLTSLWVVAMDALAVGLLAMVAGSYYMWYRLKRSRRLGCLILSGGFVSLGLFLSGVAWRR